MSISTLYQDKQGNSIRYSSVREWDGPVQFHGISAKYVIRGVEEYCINSQLFYVTEGQYILGNNSTKGNAKIQSKSDVFGLCIDISENLILEICKKNNLEQDFIKFLCTEDLLIYKYSRKNTFLGNEIFKLSSKLSEGETQKIDAHLFFHLAENLIQDQLQIFKHLKRLSFKKNFTNHEVFKLIFKCKEYLDSNYDKQIQLNGLAFEIGLSKYHLCRLFQDVFEISIYQYVIEQRIMRSLQLLSSGKSVKETSVEVGYSNVSSFSKTFLKKMNMHPSHYRIKNSANA